MSTITEQKKNGRLISFKFTACLGRENGKRIYKSTTWKPPEGLSYSKARKQAGAEAFRWEQELRFAGETPLRANISYHYLPLHADNVLAMDDK